MEALEEGRWLEILIEGDLDHFGRKGSRCWGSCNWVRRIATRKNEGCTKTA
jgi:hypothetical protein